MDDRPNGLLSWQHDLYPENHRDRTNLVLHVLTVPLFVLGIVSLIPGVLMLRPMIIGGGLVAAAIAVVLQGRGHRLEAKPPEPFRGPRDVVCRIFAEQFVTFPRFVIGGGLTRAWRTARAAEEE